MCYIDVLWLLMCISRLYFTKFILTVIINFFLLLFPHIFFCFLFFSCIVPPTNAVNNINLLYTIQMYDNNNTFCVKLYINIILWLLERTHNYIHCACWLIRFNVYLYMKKILMKANFHLLIKPIFSFIG